MENRIVAASEITSAFLSAETPQGLFQSFGGTGPRETFLIVMIDAKPHAIVVEGDPQSAFRILPLEPNTEHWQGIAMGKVEIMIDPATAKHGDYHEPSVGDVILGPGSTMIRCRSDGFVGRFNVTVSGPRTSDRPTHVFASWRLVQRDHDGKPIVLFERQPAV
jgi:hypothetical protein